MTDFRVLRFFTRWGVPISIAAGSAIPVLAAIAMAGSTWSWLLLVAAIGLGSIVGAFLILFAELVRVIVDMLLPT
jgi:hypothetical protein